MTPSPSIEAAPKPRGAAPAVLVTGLIAGTLDIAAAFIQAYVSFGTSPERVLQYIASGVFGRSAFAGGLVMASWGLLFHLFIAWFWTALFFFLRPRIRPLRRNQYVVGLAYGIVIWCGMNLVVLPLSNIPPRTMTFGGVVRAILILMALVGLPISIMARRFHSTRHP